SLLAMRVTPAEKRGARGAVIEELVTGYRYVASFVPVRTALILLAVVASMGMPYTVLMPIIATNVFHGGPHTLGFLMTASGAGAVIGALYLASRKTVVGLGRVMALATTAFGLGLVAFGLVRSFWLAMLILPIVGGGMMVEMASTNTILQTITEERLRGRVMAFYTMAFLGTAPIGSLIAGTAASHIGASATIVIGGVVCLAGAAWLTLRLPKLREQVRPIYLERGILSAAQVYPSK
ncbi:MAG TPA: MFS transporter, partial [Gemmatimonadaceae bacterium]|nr:MFS transporter [Gemmatimonadaceae bacterium]